ncbi:MAG TPA: FAD-dependent oxidoreductase, partial [Gammaproteobacteria bacterium]|nr:FAD-dependent oxidoreductase [Gammaproteobacteria bacterium]
KSHVQVAVIGGGVVGCSVLYHLTKQGFKDVVLIERDELTSGSTWHAAGGMHTLNSDPNVAKLQDYTIRLYKEIEEISGQSCGVHITGGVLLAGSRARMDWLKAAHARGRYLGMQTELLSVDEAAERFPLMEKKYFVGALYDAVEGHIDPAGVTNAYAKAARVNGAGIYRHNRVTDLRPRPDGSWDVVTEEGSLHAEHVVNAGGLWAREVGRMVGLELPILAMEHQYLITEDMPEVMASKEEVLHAIDFEGEIYMRQERNGMLMGTYEKKGLPWSERTTPWDFGHDLLPPDIDRIAPSLEVGFKHFPAFERAGIKQIINGPFTFAPDGNPLVGPVRGLRNFWVACGVMAGFSQGGGVGLALSNWIADGDPGFDVWAMDVARYGDWTSMAYTNAKVRENYSRRFRITFPNEELPAARPLRTTPIYERLKDKNAVFGVSYGLEHALWFAPEGQDPVEDVTFRRSNAFGPVAEECRAVREAAGLLEISNFAKYEVKGRDAEGWLSLLLASRMPRQGRIALTPMLNPEGKLIGDFTVAKAGPERFYIFGSGVAEEYHLRWFESRLPANGVSLRSMTAEITGLSVAGPKSREVIARLTNEDVSNEAFKFMAFRETTLDRIPVKLGRITYTGDLGYEIWVRADYQRTLYDLLVSAGADLGLKHFGGRALNSLRLEKSFGSWAREFRPIYGPFEAGLG